MESGNLLDYGDQILFYPVINLVLCVKLLPITLNAMRL